MYSPPLCFIILRDVTSEGMRGRAVTVKGMGTHSSSQGNTIRLGRGTLWMLMVMKEMRISTFLSSLLCLCLRIIFLQGPCLHAFSLTQVLDSVSSCQSHLPQQQPTTECISDPAEGLGLVKNGHDKNSVQLWRESRGSEGHASRPPMRDARGSQRQLCRGKSGLSAREDQLRCKEAWFLFMILSPSHRPN